jgi:uncharacterized Fe-S center protein
MGAKVYQILPRSKRYKYESGLMGKFENFLKDFEVSKYIGENEVVPLKMHLGNEGAFKTIRPQFVQKVVERIKHIPAKPFITDSVRIGGYDYLDVANKAGYNHLSLGAPIIIADGIYGNDSIKVKAGSILGDIAIASAIYDAKSMVVLTHVKGHIQAVLGGAIKNISMGGVSAQPRGGSWKHGRGKMHFIHGDIMQWDGQKCTLCLDCMNICPAECITFPDNVYTVYEKKCFRCGRCARVCPVEAIAVPTTHENFMKAVAEGAKAVLSTFKKDKVLYINFLLEMQPECDCMPLADTPVAQDQGILISDDPVAIDMATLDILASVTPLPGSVAENLSLENGKDIFTSLYNKDARIQLFESEKFNIGSTEYTLEVVE